MGIIGYEPVDVSELHDIYFVVEEGQLIALRIEDDERVNICDICLCSPAYATAAQQDLIVWSDTPEEARQRAARGIANLENQLVKLTEVNAELLAIAELFRDELNLSVVMTGPLAEKVARLSEQVDAAIAKAEGT